MNHLHRKAVELVTQLGSSPSEDAVAQVLSDLSWDDVTKEEEIAIVAFMLQDMVSKGMETGTFMVVINDRASGVPTPQVRIDDTSLSLAETVVSPLPRGRKHCKAKDWPTIDAVDQFYYYDHARAHCGMDPWIEIEDFYVIEPRPGYIAIQLTGCSDLALSPDAIIYYE
jgi:hypothetical protein